MEERLKKKYAKHGTDPMVGVGVGVDVSGF